MATAIRRPFEDEEEHTDKRRKVERIIEREVSCSRHKCYIDASFVEFEFGPSELNLYQYVGSESRCIWKTAKDKFILKKESEPKKGLLLLHRKGIDVQDLCWREFEFDPTSTSFANVNEKLTSQGDMVWMFDFNEQFWKSFQAASLQTIKDMVHSVKKSQIFIIVDSEDAKHHAVSFCKESKLCPQKHVLKTASDKSVLYETMYKILENQLESFLNDLNSRRTSTRLVHTFIAELKMLLGKLRSRKTRPLSFLSKSCIAKIKSGSEYGIVGHRLCGDVLYIFEDDKMSIDEHEKREFQKSIQGAFNGKIQYRSIREVMTPHCSLKCGGRFQNKKYDISGTLGIFGLLKEINGGSSQDAMKLVALSSGHVINADTEAFVSALGRVGLCIWPANSTQNIHDVSVIKIDQKLIDCVLQILNENITVEDIPLENLEYRQVFKYGATTGRTVGHVEEVSDFQVYGDNVMAVLPSSNTEVFADKGDSGAIVLTRYRGKLHGIGVVYGGGMKLEGRQHNKKEIIAVFLKKAMERFTIATQRTIVFDKI